MAIEDLTWAVGALAELSTQEFEVDQLLRRLCDVAAGALPVDGVGVMKTDAECSTRFVHATDPPLIGLEQLQEILQEGPCRDAIDTGHMIAVATPAEMRWPAFQQVAADIGMQAVLAVPMVSRGRVFGTLDLYWRTEHSPTTDDRAAAQLLANVAVSYLVMAEDRAQSRHAQEELAHQVLHDQLTGLPNRGLMQELIDHALAAADRRGTLVAVLFVDLDDFKRINDTYGHHSGDQVLQIVAHRMVAGVRAGDTVGRISGDEFVILCPDVTDQDAGFASITALGQRVREHIAQPVQLRGGPDSITVTASIGVAVTADQCSAADLVHTADLAMYDAKTVRGRDIVMVRR